MEEEEEIMIKEFPKNINYLIHSHGRVFSKKKQIFLKPEINNGYYRVKLSGIHYFIHILVAICFVENPDPINNVVVDHIDEDRLNCHYSNLEWITHQENSLRASRKRGNTHKGRPVLQYDMLGNFIAEYPSMVEAEKETTVNRGSISNCCAGRSKSTFDKKGNQFIWKYKEESPILEKPEGDSLSNFPNYIITRQGTVYNINNQRYINLFQIKTDIYSLTYIMMGIVKICLLLYW